MVKQKRKLVVRNLTDRIHVYHADLEFVSSQLIGIEGITDITIYSKSNLVSGTVNPLYDADEIASEIEELLSAEVPDVFRE